MSHTREQQVLQIAISRRDQAEAELLELEKRVKALAVAEELGRKSEAAAHAQVEQAAANKVRSGSADNTASTAARSVYQQAVIDLSVAEVEHSAGRRVLQESEAEVERLRNAARDAAAMVAVALDNKIQGEALEIAKGLGALIKRHRALIRYATTAASHSGLREPIQPEAANNPFTVRLKELLDGADLDTVSYSETAMLDAKLGGAVCP